MKPTNPHRNDTHARPRYGMRRTAVALSWALVAALAAFIFWMSSKDGITLDEGSGVVSAVKAALSQAALAIAGHEVDVSPIGHFCEFFAFGAALANALRWHVPLRTAAMAALLAASAYGASDEFHQLFVPMRSCDPLDWLVDTVAGGAGAALAYLALKRRR